MPAPTESQGERIRVLLEVISDDESYLLLRRLLRRRQRQADLIRDKVIAQGVASTRLQTLRRLGLIEVGRAGVLRVAHREAVLGVLHAAAQLSEQLDAAAVAERRRFMEDSSAPEHQGNWEPRSP